MLQIEALTLQRLRCEADLKSARSDLERNLISGKIRDIDFAIRRNHLLKLERIAAASLDMSPTALDEDEAHR